MKNIKIISICIFILAGTLLVIFLNKTTFVIQNKNESISDANSFTVVSQPSLNTSEWKDYSYFEYDVSFKYPSNYTILTKSESTSLENKIVIRESDSAYFFLGDSTAFSTSGALCMGSARCKQDKGSFVFKIDGKDYIANLIEQYKVINQDAISDAEGKIYNGDKTVSVPEPKLEFDGYLFQIGVPNIDSGFFITGYFKSKDSGQKIANIISTIKLGPRYQK